MGIQSYSNRLTTDSCKSLSVKFLNEYHYFDGGIRQGGCSWGRNGKETNNIGFMVSTIKDEGYVHFQYVYTNGGTGEKTELNYRARLIWVPHYFGGGRWWFICPLVINDQPCNRRVGVLYLGNGKYFGCRHCYNLTYQSCKDSHSFDKAAREIGMTPQEYKSALKNLGYI